MKATTLVIKCDLCNDIKEIELKTDKPSDYCELSFDNIVKHICIQCCIEITKHAVLQGVLKID